MNLRTCRSLTQQRTFFFTLVFLFKKGKRKRLWQKLIEVYFFVCLVFYFSQAFSSSLLPFLIFADSGKKMEKLFVPLTNSCVLCWLLLVATRSWATRKRKNFIFLEGERNTDLPTLFIFSLSIQWCLIKSAIFIYWEKKRQCDRCQVILIADALFELLIWLLMLCYLFAFFSLVTNNGYFFFLSWVKINFIVQKIIDRKIYFVYYHLSFNNNERKLIEHFLL